MKALSIRQPWASLLVDGVKLYQYRPSDYTYRGLVAIHASKSRGPLERWAPTQPDVLRHLPPVEDLPSGCDRGRVARGNVPSHRTGRKGEPCRLCMRWRQYVRARHLRFAIGYTRP
jgi:hypothetical protein